MPVASDLDYLAGLVDADGHISLQWSNRRGLCYPLLGVTNTHIPLLDWLKNTFGGGYYISRRADSPRHKPLSVWRLQGAAAIALLGQIQHRLHVKSAQAWLAREFWAQYTPTPKGMLGGSTRRGQRVLSDEERALRLGFVEAMHYLNQTGPSTAWAAGGD